VLPIKRNWVEALDIEEGWIELDYLTWSGAAWDYRSSW